MAIVGLITVSLFLCSMLQVPNTGGVTSCDSRWKTTTIQTQIQTLNLPPRPAFDDEHNNGYDGVLVEELGKGVMKLPIENPNWYVREIVDASWARGITEGLSVTTSCADEGIKAEGQSFES
jgi:hypothetical protein